MVIGAAVKVIAGAAKRCALVKHSGRGLRVSEEFPDILIVRPGAVTVRAEYTGQYTADYCEAGRNTNLELSR